MGAKNIENVTGLVERVSDKGTAIKLGGEWLNVGQYQRVLELPQPGERVDVEIERTDRAAWIQAVRVLDGGKVYSLPQQGRRGGVRGSNAGRAARDPPHVRARGRGRVRRQSPRHEGNRRAERGRQVACLDRAADTETG